MCIRPTREGAEAAKDIDMTREEKLIENVQAAVTSKVMASVKTGVHSVVVKELRSELSAMRAAYNKASVQRDQWKAKAGEYKEHANRYQRALIEERSKK